MTPHGYTKQTPPQLWLATAFEISKLSSLDDVVLWPRPVGRLPLTDLNLTTTAAGKAVGRPGGAIAKHHLTNPDENAGYCAK